MPQVTVINLAKVVSMFGFGDGKKSVPLSFLANSLVGLTVNDEVIEGYKELLNTKELNSHQLQEIYIFHMYATVRAVQSSIDSRELSLRLLDRYHKGIYNILVPERSQQTLFEDLIQSRYAQYYELAQNTKDSDPSLYLGEAFLNNFFGNKDDGEFVMAVAAGSLYVSQISTTKGFLDEIQSKFELI